MAGGQIYQGSDYGQNIGGAGGVGAYVPSDDNTHENQAALDRAAQIALEHERYNAKKQDEEKLRRQKAIMDIQADPKGIRPIDKDQFLANQDAINTYATMAYAHDQDPFDPKTGETFKKMQALMNTQSVFGNTSSLLQKQIADESKMYAADGGKKFQDSSMGNISTAANIPMSDYLSGKHERIKLGSTFLDPTDQFDWNKHLESFRKGGQEWEENQGSNKVRYKGTNWPASEGVSSGAEEFGKYTMANPRAANYVKEQFANPNNAPLAQQAVLASQKLQESTGKYIEPENFFAQYIGKPALTKSYAGQHEDADAASSRRKSERKFGNELKESDDIEIGKHLYHKGQQALAGKGEGYVDGGGNWVSTDFVGPTGGEFMGPEGKPVKDYFVKVQLDPNNPQITRVYTAGSVMDARTSGGAPYTTVPTDKFLLEHGTNLAKNMGAKNVGAAMKGLHQAGKEDFKPGFGYSNKNYQERVMPKAKPLEAPEFDIKLGRGDSVDYLDKIGKTVIKHANILRDIATGKTNQNVPKADIQESFNTQWKSAKKGDKITGPDGVTYIKK